MCSNHSDTELHHACSVRHRIPYLLSPFQHCTEGGKVYSTALIDSTVYQLVYLWNNSIELT